MRRLGHRVVDIVVDRVEALAGSPAIGTGEAAALRDRLGGPVPELGSEADGAIDLLVSEALGAMQQGDHPRFFARIPSPASFAGILGDWLATGHNAIASSWGGGAGPATVELVVLEWLRELLGMPAGAEGVLVSGGSLANLTGIAAARAARGPGAVYLSDQTHASIPRALRALGVGDEEIRILPSDGALRLPADALAAAVREDRSAGGVPRIVVATAGTTNTGAVDPLEAIADLCASEGLWLHVDGAYGAPAALCDAGRAVLAGIERADSLVLDPHKWLFQPYDAGCLLVREPGVLAGAFSIAAEYLADVSAGPGEADFRDRGLELTRRARAVKLWLTFRIHGAEAIRAAIARGITLAEHAEATLRADERWEVVTPAQLGIVTFARRGADASAHRASAAALAASGYAAVSTTILEGRTVLRLCTIHPQTAEAEIEETLARLA